MLRQDIADYLGATLETAGGKKPSDRLHRPCLPIGFFTKLTRTARGVPVPILVVLVKDLAGSLEVGLGGPSHQ
jgi:hypothetical protein